MHCNHPILCFSNFYFVLSKQMLPFSGAIVSRFKPATQANSLIYLFEWTAGKAVDGDYRSGNPNFDASCAASEQATGNYWRVDLIQQYIVDRVLIFSRSDGKFSVLICIHPLAVVNS